jgi:Tfp pilus assembly protein PilV
MIEVLLALGFLAASLLALVVITFVHNRAERLTVRRIEASTPLSIEEIRADKDQLRAEFAMSTRRLEFNIEQLRAKTASQL